MRYYPSLNPPFRPSDGGLPPPAFPPGSTEELDLTQRRILEFINSHPGVHLRQICRELRLGMGDVQYHTNKLERDGRINSVRRGLYRFFYPSNLFGERQRDILSVLAMETPRELLLHLIEQPDSSQDELAHSLGVSQPTVSWHLKRLVGLGILQKHQTGRAATYNVAGKGVADIATFIRNYHPSVWERWSGRLADIFISYSSGEVGREEE